MVLEILIIQLFVAQDLAEYAGGKIVVKNLEEQKIVALRAFLTQVFHANLHLHLA
jgi:hypothetical protein